MPVFVCRLTALLDTSSLCPLLNLRLYSWHQVNLSLFRAVLWALEDKDEDVSSYYSDILQCIQHLWTINIALKSVVKTLFSQSALFESHPEGVSLLFIHITECECDINDLWQAFSPPCKKLPLLCCSVLFLLFLVINWHHESPARPAKDKKCLNVFAININDQYIMHIIL